jgi:Lipocalin-like domain
MKKILFTLLVGTLVLGSCKKKDDDTPPVCEKTAAGIAGNYKTTKVEVNTGGGFSDVTNVLLDVCEKDDVYKFNANGTFQYEDAGTVCSPSGSGTGTWSVANGKLTAANSGSSFDFASATINSNDCTTFIVEESQQGSTIKVTFTKQ